VRASSLIRKSNSKTSHSIGLEAEALVEAYYVQKDFRLLKRRWKNKLAEVDLLFSYPKIPEKLLIVEVKKRSAQAFRDLALKPRQIHRIRRVAQSLMEKGFLVECHMVFVDQNSQIEVFSDVFC
jgi:Holliday junction resolvase-like predicted endonuclease